MADPLDSNAAEVPTIGCTDLVIVDGRTFAISDRGGQMRGATHGLVHDDRRHLCELVVLVGGHPVEVLAASTPTPLSAVVVGRMGSRNGSSPRAVLTRRRWVAGGMREDIHVHNNSPEPQDWTLQVGLAADFAHVFDVKAGVVGPSRGFERMAPEEFRITAAEGDCASNIRVTPGPDGVDATGRWLRWDLSVAPRTDVTVSITVEPVVDGEAAGLAFPIGSAPSEAIPMRRLEAWQAVVPRVVSDDPRVAHVVGQSLADIAALRIIDSGHVDRAVVAAGAPWFMTLFGRDSLLTSWMTLPFEPTLARGVLRSLADLQGQRYDSVAEEQPGKILHELRRHGGGGPFAQRDRYYGTVDATPLFVMLAGEAARWRAIDDDDLAALAPALDAAVAWMLGDADSNGDGFLDYRRSTEEGLSNQGWKDSWDGVTFPDGSLPEGPIALVEVQGYAYAALLAAAELTDAVTLTHDRDRLGEAAAALRERFNEHFWDDRGFYVVGLDGAGRRIDSLTSNPGHALWTGIADDERANQYLDRVMSSEMWTGWGLRTLADSMDAYDPLSYHNGSVWPHDTALCAAGAARHGRWDVVDAIYDGAFAAATAFVGRPPELFAGIHRSETPMPVSYPSSCSPQAWSSASILLMLRSLVGLQVVDGEPRIDRGELEGLADLTIERLHVGKQTWTMRLEAGTVELVRGPPV